MRYLYNKKGVRGGDGERGQFAFFVIGAIVVITVVFVIGLQIGRVIEKGSWKPEGPSGKVVVGESPRDNGAIDIRKTLGAYSEDAAKIRAVPPPSAKEQAGETEKGLTFRETLAKKDSVPVPLERPVPGASGTPSPANLRTGGGGRFVLQAGAFRRKPTAEATLGRLVRAGYPAAVSESAGKDGNPLYRVVVGPYAAKGDAVKAAKRIKDDMKINAFVSGK